jgi:hypothetical protein
MGLSTAQLGAVQRLVQSAPDALLTRLSTALSTAKAADPVFAPVCDVARTEFDDRRARDIVLEPLKPLADPSLVAPKESLLSAADLGHLWRLMRTVSPEGADSAVRAALALRRHEPPPPLFDDLCLLGADALRDSEAVGPTTVWSAAHRDRMAKLLTMTPVLRAALPKLPAWVRNMTGEHMAAVRLAFKDATAREEDAGPLFMEALLVHLDEPSHILRLISAVTDRPTDRYLASSELAGIGERLLDDIDRRVQAVRKFDPDRGFEGGGSEAVSVQLAANAIREFEQWLALNKEGPWGSRIATQKIGLAQAAEARLREVEPAVSAALPLQAQRVPGGRAPRAGPRIDDYPNASLVRRAEGLLAFLDETRSSATNAGFGSLRAKVIESLEQRMDTYVQDLVERLHDADCADPEWVRAYLDVAADFCGMIKGPQAAQIVRRRAAAA